MALDAAWDDVPRFCTKGVAMKDIPLPTEPYVALPSDVSADEFDAIVRHFEKIGRVLHGKELPVASFGAGGEVVEFTNWLVNFSPTLFRNLALWALVTYTGKEFAQGFAAEAGKDFWKGVKFLGELAIRKMSRDPDKANGHSERFVVIRTMGTPDAARPYFYVEIAIPVASDEASFTRRYEQVERFFLPLTGCLSLGGPEVRLRILPDRFEKSGRCWEVHNTATATVYSVDLEKQVFRQLSFPANLTDPTIACMSSFGLKHLNPGTYSRDD
jgi:hypothetical protein